MVTGFPKVPRVSQWFPHISPRNSLRKGNRVSQGPVPTSQGCPRLLPSRLSSRLAMVSGFPKSPRVPKRLPSISPRILPRNGIRVSQGSQGSPRLPPISPRNGLETRLGNRVSRSSLSISQGPKQGSKLALQSRLGNRVPQGSLPISHLINRILLSMYV